MPAIRALLVWKIPQALTSVWADSSFAVVDLERLTTARDKRAHRVGPPLGEVADSEAVAMVARLRIGLEDVRRRLDDQQGEWWPLHRLSSLEHRVRVLGAVVRLAAR